MNVSYFLLSEGSSPFITTNDNPIHKAAHRNTDQLSISFSDIGVLPTNYDNKRLHRVLPHRQEIDCFIIFSIRNTILQPNDGGVPDG